MAARLDAGEGGAAFAGGGAGVLLASVGGRLGLRHVEHGCAEPAAAVLRQPSGRRPKLSIVPGRSRPRRPSSTHHGQKPRTTQFISESMVQSELE